MVRENALTPRPTPRAPIDGVESNGESAETPTGGEGDAD